MDTIIQFDSIFFCLKFQALKLIKWNVYEAECQKKSENIYVLLFSIEKMTKKKLSYLARYFIYWLFGGFAENDSSFPIN